MRNCVMGAMHMHLTQDTAKESDKNTIKRNTQESKEARPFFFFLDTMDSYCVLFFLG